MKKLRLLDLFSGIGGFSLGLERSGGFETVAFCEIDPFCRRVLKKHWPQVRQYEDVREVTAARLAADGIGVDAICGGFPCQDISFAGKGAGIDGERSGLWSEYARLIGELRPKFVIVENVAALLSRGLERVLGDLASLGFDAEWHCIPASAVGAPHRRDRIWIIADPNADLHTHRLANRKNPGSATASQGGNSRERAKYGQRLRPELSTSSETYVADAGRSERHWWIGGPRWWDLEPLEALQDARSRGRQEDGLRISESELGRVAYGLPYQVERLGALGNAVVPQIPELIGRAIMEARLSIPNPQPGEQ